MIALSYFGEIAVAVLLAIVLLAFSTLPMSAAAALVAAGCAAWTLGEYVGHRFVLHHLVPSGHLTHHARPNAAIFTVFWQIWLCLGFVWLIAGGAFAAGALIAYGWYLFVHHCAHHDPGHIPAKLLRHHRLHHRMATRNYGVSTRLWDRLFGTALQ